MSHSSQKRLNRVLVQACRDKNKDAQRRANRLLAQKGKRS